MVGAASLTLLTRLLLTQATGLLLTQAAGLVATAATVLYSVRAVHLLFFIILQELERRRP